MGKLRLKLAALLSASLLFSLIVPTMGPSYALGMNEFVYDFKLSIENSLEDNGWKLTDKNLRNIENAFRNQVYGIQVQSNNVGQYVEFDIIVPQSGFYEVEFLGAGAASGGIAEILIDGQLIGDYNFYSENYIPEKVREQYNIIELDQGIHKLKFLVTEKVGSFAMYLAGLTLTKVDAEPSPYYEYSFYNAFAENSNIRVVGDKTVSPVTTRQMLYGSSISATELGQSRSFEFDVPAAGYYLVRFQGYTYMAAGIGDLLIDGEYVGNYDFYSSSSEFGPGKKLKTVYLDAGTHTMTFHVSGRNQDAEQTSNYSMYPFKLSLTQQSGPAALHLDASLDKHTLLLNETTRVHTSVYMSDETPLEEVWLTYASEDEQVATVGDDGIITAVSGGSTTIHITAASEGLTAQRALPIEVVDAALEHVSLTLASGQDEISLYNSDQLIVSGTLSDGRPANLAGADIFFTSEDPSTVEVDEDGNIVGLQVGTTTLSATVILMGVERTAELQVKVLENHLEAVELIVDKDQLVESEYVKATVTGKLDNDSDLDLARAEVVFSSEDEQILQKKSEDGFFKAVGIGEAELEVAVTYNGVTKMERTKVEVTKLTSSKTRSTYYTEEKVENARHNVRTYEWAKGHLQSSVSAAQKYLEAGWDFLWSSVPPQTIPRSYAVNQPLGSPVTGKEIDKWGNYPYEADPFKEPWKIIDPSAQDENGENYRFPTNDFMSYYESGLDDHGIFQRGLADPQYLVNELYPEKGETWGVDDGYGWVDEDGNYYTFISYYTHWHLWHGSGVVVDALRSLKNAYIYSGEKEYAQAGIIILDRIADVYPSLDLREFDRSIYWHSDGGRAGGKAVGSIWETGLVKEFISAYDAFFPAMDESEVMDDVLEFLQEKGEQYKLSYKDSVTGIRHNIEEGILKEVYPSVKNANILGNNGFHQSALALAAVVYDTLPETKEWLDFNFQSGGIMTNPYRVTGGNILAGLVNTVDRDGHGNESSPGYNNGWLSAYLQVADILHGYDKYPEADLYENVKFRKMFGAMYPLTMLERYTPTIGDTGSAGNPMHVLNKEQMIRAFEVYREPIYAQLAYFLNHHRVAGIHSDVFTANPDQIAAEIEAVIDEYGPFNMGSTNLAGYGFVGLRDGERTVPQYENSLYFMDLDVIDASVDYRVFESNATVQLEATEPGHSITFAFPVEMAGEYEVLLRPWRAPTYAKYNVYINDQFVKEVDFFGSSKEMETLATMEMEEGEHHISFRYSGITEGAGNYKMGVTELRLQDPQDDVILEPIDTMRGMWLYHGITSGHGHRDALNLGIHSFGLDLAPDLGYPKFADAVDMHRAQWMNNTISHNTVVVNQRKQNVQAVGIPKHYDGKDGKVQLIDVAAPKAYSTTSEYRRTAAMIRVDDENSYIVDFFKVRGGNDHHFSFHSMEGEVSVEGLELVSQIDENGEYVGTYAGPDVPLGERVDDVDGPGYMGSGFHWLKDVDRAANPPAQFSVDWNVKDTWNVYGRGASAPTDVHLRLTMLTQLDEAALASGLPPDNKPGNPEEIRYFIGHRTGTELDSLFTSVIEPYEGERFVQSIEKVAVTQADGQAANDHLVQAVKVELDDGRTDYIVYSLDAEQTYRVDGQFRFNGFFGVYSLENESPSYRYVHDGTMIAAIDEEEAGIVLPSVSGTIVDFTRELAIENEITVDLDLAGLAAEDLIDEWIYVQNDQVRNGVYQIKEMTALGDDRYRLDIGDITLVRSFADVNDFSKGYVYDISPGASFAIPLSHVLETELNDEEQLYSLQEQLEALIKKDEVKMPLTMQLRQTLRQAIHHAEGGRQHQSRKFVQDFINQINNEAHQAKISVEAKGKFMQQAEQLLRSME